MIFLFTIHYIYFYLLITSLKTLYDTIIIFYLTKNTLKMHLISIFITIILAFIINFINFIINFIINLINFQILLIPIIY